MAIQIEYRYTAPEGLTFVPIEDWIKTQSAEDQTKFAAAKERQTALNDQLKEQGHVTQWGDHTMIVDEEQTDKFDTEIKAFYLKYQLETGMNFETVKTVV
jgi:hypothetical protein